jgi:hypothetical protein
MSCAFCDCESKPNPNPDLARDDLWSSDWWLTPNKPMDNGEKYISIGFFDDDGDIKQAILYLGKKPHIHGLFANYWDLSENAVYSFEATIVSGTTNDKLICPYTPRKVTVGNTTMANDLDFDAQRIVIQQHVIAFNQKQHRAADAVRDGIPESIIPDLKRIIIEFAVLIPIGPRLEHQIIPTFYLGDEYDCRADPASKRNVDADLEQLKDLFHVFDWHAANPRISHWERPRASVEVLE